MEHPTMKVDRPPRVDPPPRGSERRLAANDHPPNPGERADVARVSREADCDSPRWARRQLGAEPSPLIRLHLEPAVGHDRARGEAFGDDNVPLAERLTAHPGKSPNQPSVLV